MAQHNDSAKEWGNLLDRDLNPHFISYLTKTNSSTVQGERNMDGAQVATLSQKGEGNE